MPGELGVIAHSYQLPRELWLRSCKERLAIVPEFNEKIHKETYHPVLVQNLPQKGFIFSFFGTLREWMKREEPRDYRKIRSNIRRLPDKELKVLGDPYLHVILPLLPEKDQEMLLQIGQKAFVADLGFKPKGVWLPETAVSEITLQVLSKQGYEYTVLGDCQTTGASGGVVRVETPPVRGINVLRFNSGLSGKLSYVDSVSENGDDFLARYSSNTASLVIATDLEFYGHHKPFRDKFLFHILSERALKEHGLNYFNVGSVLNRNTEIARVVEGTSWSCPHRLGRWTGEAYCDCDRASFETRLEKRRLLRGLLEENDYLNFQLNETSVGWRLAFVENFLDARGTIFSGDEFEKKFLRRVTASQEKKDLLLAKLYTLIGFTSCGWFFGKGDSVERRLPEACLNEASILTHPKTVF